MEEKVYTFSLYLDDGNDLIQIKVIASDEGSAKGKVNRLLHFYVDTEVTGLYLNDVENR